MAAPRLVRLQAQLMLITDLAAGERIRQGVAVELRIRAGPRHGAHVDQPVHSVGSQYLDELIEAARQNEVRRLQNEPRAPMPIGALAAMPPLLSPLTGFELRGGVDRRNRLSHLER
jgi:hypothetical protein